MIELRGKHLTDLAKGVDVAHSVDTVPVIHELAGMSSVWNKADFKDRDGRVYRRSHFTPMTLADVEREFADRLVEKQTFQGNLLLNEGINEAFLLICALGSPTAFSAAAAYLGAGDSATAAVATQTGLQASSNKYYQAMDAAFPTSGTQKATWKSTFGTAVANFDWNECTVANGNSDSAKNLNRKVQAMGTKTSAVSRVLTLDITLS